ncbi:membrane bound O-acyl transferase family-domain-containing protein [Mycena crocata]|nr:membrane bound O-acyl transferase family-domain-containing protein [Mycena crocata]
MSSPPTPFPNWAFPAFLLLSFIPLVVKSSPYRRLYFLPVLALTYYTLNSTTGNVPGDYAIASGWLTLLFVASDFILVTDVQNDLRSVKPPQVKPISQEGLGARLSWAWHLFTSVRGIGWAHEPVGVLPPRPTGTRAQFVIKRLASLVFCWLLFDLAVWHNGLHPSFSRGGESLTAYGWVWRYQCVGGWATSAYIGMAMPNCVLSILSVTLGRSDPEDWPWLFGSFSETWSIRRFWGRTWHQIMRRFVSSHGRLVCRILGLTPGTNASSYVQLYTAFFMSSIVHYLSDYMALQSWHGGSMKFFMAQAVAITAEDGLFALGRRAGVKGGYGWRLLGYAWVWSWFALVFPTWQDPLLRQGMLDDGATSVLQQTWNNIMQ